MWITAPCLIPLQDRSLADLSVSLPPTQRPGDTVLEEAVRRGAQIMRESGMVLVPGAVPNRQLEALREDVSQRVLAPGRL